MAKQIQSLNSVLYHDLKVHEVARRNRYNLLWYWLHMKGYRSNLKDTFYEFFFYERGSVSMYDRQVDTLIKLSTFEKYVYFNQPIKILEICPNSLLSHGILSYFEHQKNNR